jgi:RecT family
MLGLNGSALPKNRIGNSEDHEQDLDLQEPLEGTEPSAQIKRSTRTNLSGARNLIRQPNSNRGPKPLLPRSLKEALQLASLLSKSKLIPKGFDNPEACLVGILYGMEVGLSPIAALQRMAIIDGRPTIWGDAALALVEASGLLIKIEERIESDPGQTKTAVCQVLRSGRAEPITRTFSIEDAKRAGLWQKPGPWTDYPDRMLMMRARAFALRDAFPDVLMGLYLREEFEGVEAETRYAKPELGSSSDTFNSRTGSDSKKKSYLGSNHSIKDLEPGNSDGSRNSHSAFPVRRAPPPPMEIEATTPTPEDNDTFIGIDAALADPQQSANPLDLFDSALACAQDTETLEEIREEFNERIDRLDTEGLQEAGRIFLRHEKRIRVAEEAFADEPKQSDNPSENEDEDLSEDIIGQIGTGSLSPHRTRRRFSIRPRKGLTLAELNARRKVDLLKYSPQAKAQKDEADD